MLSMLPTLDPTHSSSEREEVRGGWDACPMPGPFEAKKRRNELRHLVGPFVEKVSDMNLDRLLAICPDVDLLAAAILMSPRPAWVIEIAGKL
jgi:hypothetical protein